MGKNKKKVKAEIKKDQGLKRTESKIKAGATKIGPNTASVDADLLFGKRNFAFLLAGTGLIALGYFLMSGGNMPSPDVWDESLIYSTRRTLVAPIIILLGLGLQFYTIFAKK